MELYPLIKPPKTLNQNFETMTLEEAQDYLNWMLSIKRERLDVLQEYVLMGKPQTYDTLMYLYAFLLKHVYWIPNFQFQIFDFYTAKIKQDSLFLVRLDYLGVAEPTKTLCFDISLFFGEFLIQESNNRCFWDFVKDKNQINYGLPSISSPKFDPSGGVVVFLHIGNQISNKIKYKDKKNGRNPKLNKKWFEQLAVRCINGVKEG